MRYCNTQKGLQDLRTETRRPLHFGVNYLIAPAGAYGPGEVLQFQQYLAKPVNGVLFDSTKREREQTVYWRMASPLEVRIGPVGPEVSQLRVLAPKPEGRLDDFVGEASTIVEAHSEVWGAPGQVLRRDCTIRHLYAVREDHAFRFLWEKRLGQTGESLKPLGRPVAGGGIRLVMPPRPDRDGDSMVEIKVESFLQDSTQLFVEATFVWGKPIGAEGLNPKELLETVENSLEGEVSAFICGSEQ